MSHADPLDRLRRINPVPGELPPPPIEPLLQQLGSSRIHRVRRRLRSATVSLVIVGLVALSFAVPVLLLVAHHQQRSRATSSPAFSASIPADAQPLAAILAVLRHPQTAADRSLKFTGEFRSGLLRNVLDGLTRHAWSLPGGLQAFIVVARPNPQLKVAADGQDRAAVIFASAAGRPIAAGAFGTAEEIRAGGALATGGLSAGLAALSGSGPSPFEMLVPDGVKTVRLLYTATPAAKRGAGEPSTTIDVPVRGNVIALRVPHAAGDLPTRISWLGNNGQLIKSIRLPRRPRPLINVPLGGAAPFANQTPIAQLNLTSPVHGSTAGGVASIFSNNNQRRVFGITVAARGVAPNGRSNAYAVWLFKDAHTEKLLGFVNPGVGHNKRLTTAGQLPADVARYTQLLITLETKANPRKPGAIILRGILPPLHR